MTNDNERMKRILDEIPTPVLEGTLEKIKNTKINILIVGGTGVGKSSTINALFDMEVCKVGQNLKPETNTINAYEFGNSIVWDTPGLGDSIENDRRYKKMLTEKMTDTDEHGDLLIDMVLLIIDGGSRDFSSAHTLLREIIAPNLGDEGKDRLLVAINQADRVSNGRHWDKDKNQPEKELLDRLDELAQITRERIKEETGFDVEVIYYSAGYKENNDKQNPYNLAKLLDYINRKLPSKKRIAFARAVNKEEKNFADNDGREDYQQNNRDSQTKSFWENIFDTARELGIKIANLAELAKDIYKTAEPSIKIIIGLFKK